MSLKSKKINRKRLSERVSLRPELLGFPACWALALAPRCRPCRPSPGPLRTAPASPASGHRSGTAQPHSRCVSAAHHDDGVLLAGAPELPAGLGGPHQPPHQPGDVASYVCLSTSYNFDRDDVAFKNLTKYFLHWSHEDRRCAEAAAEPARRPNLPSGHQETRPWRLGAWAAKECALHLEKNVNRAVLELYKLATGKNDTHLCGFIKTHYLNEQMKSIKESKIWQHYQLAQSRVSSLTSTPGHSDER